MINGSYKKSINARLYESPGAFSLFQDRASKFRWSQYNTCGTGALSVLTGISPSSIDKHIPKSNKEQHWSDKSIVKFLKDRHYTVVQISKCGITNLNPDFEWREMPLNKNHVLLCGLLMCKNEGSWWVINNNHSFHNFDVQPLDPLLFCNKPSDNIYLISKPSWKI